MSIAFREVFEEFNKVTFDSKCLTRNNRISDAFHIGEKLLLSSNNMRPKSRSKTSINSFGISKLLPHDDEMKHPVLPTASLLNTDIDILRNQNDNLVTKKEIQIDCNSNAQDYPDLMSESLKKGKRSRKRNGASVKSKKGKQGRLHTAVIGRHEKHSSLSSQHFLPNTQSVKPSRISSEPPNLMKKHEYIPCMSDIRSQRAVKSRLQEMEKEAVKKQEKRKEANIKLEKQQQKDKEKVLKVKQRREIYALNKIMTELENKRFLEFCQGKGLNEL